MTSPAFRQVRRAIYRAKRRFGQPIIICRTSSNTLDPATGHQDATLTKCSIKRAVIMPAKSLRSFAYDLSFIAANKNFTEGGFFDLKSKIVLVDWRDITAGFIIDQNAYMMVKGKRFEIKTFVEYEDEEMLAFLLTGLDNAIPLDQNVEDLSGDLGLTSTEVDS